MKTTHLLSVFALTILSPVSAGPFAHSLSHGGSEPFQDGTIDFPPAVFGVPPATPVAVLRATLPDGANPNAFRVIGRFDDNPGLLWCLSYGPEVGSGQRIITGLPVTPDLVAIGEILDESHVALGVTNALTLAPVFAHSLEVDTTSLDSLVRGDLLGRVGAVRHLPDRSEITFFESTGSLAFDLVYDHETIFGGPPDENDGQSAFFLDRFGGYHLRTDRAVLDINNDPVANRSLLISTDSSGTVQWSRLIERGGDDASELVNASPTFPLPDGGALHGEYRSELDFATSEDDSTSYLIRFDGSGNTLWSRRYEGGQLIAPRIAEDLSVAWYFGIRTLGTFPPVFNTFIVAIDLDDGSILGEFHRPGSEQVTLALSTDDHFFLTTTTSFGSPEVTIVRTAYDLSNPQGFRRTDVRGPSLLTMKDPAHFLFSEFEAAPGKIHATSLDDNFLALDGDCPSFTPVTIASEAPLLTSAAWTPTITPVSVTASAANTNYSATTMTQPVPVPTVMLDCSGAVVGGAPKLFVAKTSINGSGHLVITFPSVPGTTYHLRRSNNLSTGFTQIDSLDATTAESQFIVTDLTPSHGFFIVSGQAP